MYDMLCAGCGHRTAMMMLDDIIRERKLKEKIILALDVACCSLLIDFVEYDSIMCAHGRVLDVTKGYKEMRKENVVISYMGDGAAYSIGIEEMIHSARRNDDVLAIIINNGLYSMTGGQVAPTYVDTTGARIARPYDDTTGGREARLDRRRELCERNEARLYEGFRIEDVISAFSISYLARAALTDKENIDKAKKYVDTAFDKYIKEGGFNLVELLSPCPTNYKMTPKDAADMINNKLTKVYKIGEFINA